MAEVIGLAASIIQIAGAGAKLSSALYHFTTSAVRADQDITDIASDVELTSNALESVGKVFETEDAKSLVSKKAIQDANNIIKRCEAVFSDISELVDKRRKSAKDGKKGLSVIGKLSWPMKEQRVELHRRRLESLKNSLVLLLHVLQLAQGQARGQLEKDTLEKERDKIRDLHQRQQDSLKCLQALETKLNKVALDDEVTLTGSATTSRVPTLDLMLHNPTHDALLPIHTSSQTQQNSNKINTVGLESGTSDSEVATTDDEDEHLSLEEITTAAKHVQKLLKRITKLQHTFATTGKGKVHKKKRVNKIYQRFCRKWEADVAATRPPQPIPKLDKEAYQPDPFNPTPRPKSNCVRTTGETALPSFSELLPVSDITTGPQDESRAQMVTPKARKARKRKLRIDPEYVNPAAENLGSVERRPLPGPLYLMAPMDIAPVPVSPTVVHAGDVSAAIGLVRADSSQGGPALNVSSAHAASPQSEAPSTAASPVHVSRSPQRARIKRSATKHEIHLEENTAPSVPSLGSRQRVDQYPSLPSVEQPGHRSGYQSVSLGVDAYKLAYDSDPEVETERLEHLPGKLACTPTDIGFSEASNTRMTRSRRRSSSTVDQQELSLPMSPKNGQKTTAKMPDGRSVSPPEPRKRSSRYMRKMAECSNSPQACVKKRVDDLDFDLESMDGYLIDQRDVADMPTTLAQGSASFHDGVRETSTITQSGEDVEKVQGIEKRKRSKSSIKVLTLSNDPIVKRQRLSLTAQANMTATSNHALPDQAVERDIVDILLDQWTVTVH
ncbi:hypothetical protein HBI18_168280 [Parastagonospora nodorum]|nr:hypothetical protein HBI18_168280 [Parastagonospora nodorum]KAH6116122.1 hypothetical protein HBI64_193950 [Parastagonospora nodorum]KAH6416134.1 hypothetical protein HBI14_114020 [Parastagonospora nodorum]